MVPATPLVLVVLAASPTAPPPGATLRGQSVASFNRHGAHGADGARHDAAVTVTLEAGGRATVVDSGRSSETALYHPQGWFKEERTTWTTRWQGTWTRTGDRLEIVAARSHRACDRSETWRGQAPKRLGCREAPARLVLRCAASDVPVDGPPGTRPVRVPVWRCAAAGAADAGGTALPWVLGRDRCLRATGGRPSAGPLRYSACAP